MRHSTPNSFAPVTRRKLLVRAAVVSSSSLLLPYSTAFAQSGPPIEPIDPTETEESGNGEIIEPDGEIETPEDGQIGVDYSSNAYFAATGHNLEEPFLSAWRDAGGEDVLGLPISEARFVTDGGVQQAFQTIALYYLPENDDEGSWQVRGLPIQEERRAGLVTNGALLNPSLGARFRDYYERIGGRRFLGNAVSTEFSQDGRTRQLFECGMLETDGNTVRLRNLIEEKFTDTIDAAALSPAPPTLGVTSLVSADDGLNLRNAPSLESDVRIVIDFNSEFIAAPGDHGEWVPGYVDGYSGWVSAEYLTDPPQVPTIGASEWDLRVWQGAVISETNVRQQPDTASNTLRTLDYGTQVTVDDWVDGEAVIDTDRTWARLKDGGYIYVRNVVRNAPVLAPPVPNDAPQQGKWIDIHLTQQLMVAYEGRSVKRVVLCTTGKPGWETPEGLFSINTRVPNETMESGSIGAEEFYVLKDVLFTQYFTDRGHALHFAWWKNEQTIGRPGSHGCVNLLLDDARFFWEWAEIGTKVYCHY